MALIPRLLSAVEVLRLTLAVAPRDGSCKWSIRNLCGNSRHLWVLVTCLAKPACWFANFRWIWVEYMDLLIQH